MHSKRKGNIGQLAVAKKFAEHGYSIFTEEGDISKVDLIVEKDGKIYTVQIKAITPKKGCLTIPLRKCGPNYIVHYKQDMFNFFAVHDLRNDQVYMVSSDILQKNTTAFTLRLTESKNDINTIHYAKDFQIDLVLNQLENK